jgi:glycosyltransferase involved in cell wall biosynthesis
MYDIVVRVDADGQHDPKYINDLLNGINDFRADVVIGSRFLGPISDYQSSWVRRIGIRFFAKLISFLTSCKITDPTSGFNAFNKRAIEVFAEDYPYDFPEPESIMIAQRKGMKVVEVPVKMRKRVSGYSSIRYFKTLYYLIKVTFAILLDMIKSKRR